jgi:predicted MFS family arabinose efflux permease
MEVSTRRDLAAVLCGAAAAFLSFNVLFSVIPVIAERDGGDLGAGLSTGVFMITTVLGQLGVKRLVRVVPYRQSFMLGILLIGVPALLYAATDSFLMILAVTAVRGLGFGLCTVIATVLVIAHVQPDRRGSALGLFGLMSSGSSVFAPSLGLLLLDHWGDAVFVVCAGISVLLAASPMLSRPLSAASGSAPSTYRQMLARAPIRRPLLVLLPGTLLFGGIYSFVPLTSGHDAPLALLLFGLAMALTRTTAGRAADRVRPQLLVSFFLATAVAGALLVAIEQRGFVLFVGALLAGFGVGGLMTGTLVLLLARVSREDVDGASTLWNTSVDAGLALGGVGLGLVALVGGEASVFAAAVVALALVIPLASVEWKAH